MPLILEYNNQWLTLSFPPSEIGWSFCKTCMHLYTIKFCKMSLLLLYCYSKHDNKK